MSVRLRWAFYVPICGRRSVASWRLMLGLAPMSKLHLADGWVLVTGASSGLGREMARQLATTHKARVLAVARRGDALENLATEVARAGGCEIEPVIADLSTTEGQDKVVRAALAKDNLRAAVLNAGVTYFGEVTSQGDSSIDGLLSTNVRSVVRMSRDLGVGMTARQMKGGIMLVSSLTSLTPVPYQSVYSATKAFITTFGRCFGFEMKETGVSVSVYVPGGIDTELIDKAGMRGTWSTGSLGIMPVDKCAALGLQGMIARKDVVVPGVENKAAAMAAKLLPLSMVTRQAGAMYKKAMVKRDTNKG